ncbi:MAG: bifunctional diaminohydroxyphosphoribosylaminopyrimidine deaminase/5-amino-6-(5-phosphoribosylamino)uracil reductase RibD [Ignavibacteriales bacterium]|nr:bifunctional diaminohydroxyphosphoribosylaminopyrimidine deaminase/5-amino-6-(5-phosphoribosylamino)uracil reductase RibD [Ignavibacteriales bacterium]
MPIEHDDAYWIRRCFTLAKKGKGFTSPNPLVGAVIVKDGKVVAEGDHRRYGDDHAEVNAINAALRKNADLVGSTIYVNLEPCFHQGNTPPCVEAIIRHRFQRVVISSIDPNPLVSGKSIHKLRSSGIECTTGILEADSQLLNEKFFKYITTRLPFISLKAAQTQDGFIAKKNGASKWITNKASRRHVHELRGEYDAVMVGAATVLKDDPELTVRSAKGRNPLRIIIDGKLRLPISSKVCRSDAATILYTVKSIEKKKRIEAFEKKGVAVVPLPGKNGRMDPHQIVDDLARHNISSILIEGGQHVFSEFINAALVDKIYLFTANKSFGTGIPTFGDIRIPIIARRQSVKFFQKDILEEYYLTYSSW